MQQASRRLAQLVAAASGLHALDGSCRHTAQNRGRPESPLPTDFNKWSQYGLPAGDSHFIFRENHVVCYDARTRNAKWVLERITSETVAKGAERTDASFYEEGGVDQRFRSKLSDYNGSGYDRGHLAPAADHSHDLVKLKETFSLINISPQVGAGFNRDYWARFEKFVRDLTRIGTAVYVVTGPLFLPRRKQPKDGPFPSPTSSAKFVMEYELLGSPPNLVAVPNFFFKVVLVEQADGRRLMAAFVLPNAPIDPARPLVSFLVPIDHLERAAGLRFFSSFLTDRRRALLDDRLPLISDIDSNHVAGLLTDGSKPTSTRGSGVRVEGPVSILEPSHLCEVMQCRLPSENFWGKQPQQQQQQQQQGGWPNLLGGLKRTKSH